ncbi:MAG: PA4642 family protein [Pseudomonadales bacterium]|nr:PA4642 family protein [Pseudomonadales bacterium]
MAGPSQPSVTDEVWDDERIRSFLAVEPRAGESADHHVLLKAYRGMRPEDFERFLKFFVEAGRDLDARDKSGRTLWEIIGRHRHGAPFIEARKQYD